MQRTIVQDRKPRGMVLEIVTKEELQIFRMQLLKDLKAIIENRIIQVDCKPEGYKTTDVRSILRCSINKLVSLRVSGQIRAKKIGGTLYYNKEDVKRLLEEGY